VPKVAAVTPAGEMTAAVAATKVTTTVATTTMAAATMAAATVSAAACLGRHIGCGHHQTSGSDSRETIHSGQGPKSK
jgi:hypothetical protein